MLPPDRMRLDGKEGAHAKGPEVKSESAGVRPMQTATPRGPGIEAGLSNPAGLSKRVASLGRGLVVARWDILRMHLAGRQCVILRGGTGAVAEVGCEEAVGGIAVETVPAGQVAHKKVSTSLMLLILAGQGSRRLVLRRNRDMHTERDTGRNRDMDMVRAGDENVTMLPVAQTKDRHREQFLQQLCLRCQ